MKDARKSAPLLIIQFYFQTNLISMESLLKVIDPSQLTPDLDGGSLHYDHATWIELRCVRRFKTQFVALPGPINVSSSGGWRTAASELVARWTLL